VSVRNSERTSQTDKERNEELIKRVEANDAIAMCEISAYCHHALRGLQQDRAKAMDELLTKAVELGPWVPFMLE